MVNIINDYRLIDIIGRGSYGEVWKARHINTKKEVAIKLEQKGSKKYLKYETIILRHLNKLSNIVKIKYYGVLSKHNYLIMDLLSIPLNEYYNSIKRNNDREYNRIKWIGEKLLYCIESVHNSGIIHRDIKPSNFLLNLNYNDIIMIDFGLAKQYINKSGLHRNNNIHSSITGTVMYISLNVHNGNEPSRRDDLISMIYVIIYLLKGSLPWQCIKYTTPEDKIQKISHLKQIISPRDLCNHLPNKLLEMIDYCYDLSYDEEPNYEYLLFLIKTI